MNWKMKIVSTALALSVMVPTASFAADTAANNVQSPFKRSFAWHQRVDGTQHQAIQDKMLETITKYAPESVDEWKNAFAEREQLVKELKEKAPGMKQRNQLSDEVKEKIQSIRNDIKEGKLTPKQAREELSKLGINPAAKKFKQRNQLSDEVKEKIQSIHNDVKEGKLTPEQAREELSKLGIGGRKGKDMKSESHHRLFVQFREAVNANDENKIKELLPQLFRSNEGKKSRAVRQAVRNQIDSLNKPLFTG